MKRFRTKLFPSRQQWRENRTSFLLCALSGLFGSIIFRQNWMGIFAWVALIPYFVALSRFRTAKSIVWGTYIFGFIWYYLSLWWLHTLTVFSLLIPAVVPLGAIFEATYFLAFAFPANFAMRRLPPWLTPWALALMWPGMEYMRTWTDMAFPWNYLGHSQAGSPLEQVIQWSDYGGVYLITFLLVAANAGLMMFGKVLPRVQFRGRIDRHGIAAVSAAMCVLLVFGIAMLGSTRRANVSSTHHDAWQQQKQQLSIAVIQPGISQTKKWDAIMGVPGDDPQASQKRFFQTDREMRDAALSLVHEASGMQPQLYVLPETTFLSPFFVYLTDLHRDLRKLAIDLNADLFFGADNRVPLVEYFGSRKSSNSSGTRTLPQMPLRLDDRGTTVPDWQKEPRMANFNSAWIVTAEDGLQPAAYNKLQLVPFGETVPVIGHLEWFQKLAIAGSFYPGTDAPIFESHGVRFGSVICFESAFSSLTSALARKGAQMIVVLTNDAWYDPKYLMEKGGFWGTLFKLPFLRGLAAAGPDQHFAQSVFRAIETRLPVVRSANTGISSIILPTGDVSERLRYGTAGHFTANVRVAQNELTFYARFGDWFAWCCLVVLAGVLAWMVWELSGARKMEGQNV
ncbi:MAG: apolipoprotein N-acyltransferase [Candidatus Sumerlaeaceae bacterium]